MASPNELEVVWESRDGTTILKPDGDIDLSRSPTLRTDIRRAFDDKPKRLVIDLSGVSYMDSSGVATLVEAMQLSRKSNAKLVLCSLTDRVHSIFEIARLDQFFTITTTLDEAVSA
ncbi:MAG: STAS domain-containing protein [Phycisphaerales bacterium]|nr:STAS domain-containing protein [Phycisphaerales bacterium]MCB9837571.1 STAS domain-containing protein [Phycisphaera sp.]